MKTEAISKIWIDKDNRLCIKPKAAKFEFIYRSAMGVYWNSSECFLYPRIIGSWSPIEWYRQIVAAVKNEYGCQLYIDKNTAWESVDEILKSSIIMESGNSI